MDRLLYYLDNRSPKISRRLSLQAAGGGAAGDFDLSSGTFRLCVRPLWDDTIVIDEAMDVDAPNDVVEYSPQTGDFSIEGIYRAWIKFEDGGVEQDTDEFGIEVFVHAPGQGTRVGGVWRSARALAPVAWDAVRGYDDYGDPELQRQIELAKLRVLPIPVAPAAEDGLDLRVIDYIAKKVLVDNVLEAAINYWTNVVVSQTAQGNSAEVKTYPDRIRTAENQILRFRAALEAQAAEVTEIVGTTPGAKVPGPVLINGGVPITPSIDEMPATMRPRRSANAAGLFFAEDCP